MKKLFFWLIVCLQIGNLAMAQETPTIIVSGTVKTSQGDLLRYAFVQESPGKTGVYTDSLGSFTLSVKNTSRLRISCFGYRDTLFKPVANGNLIIILTPVVTIAAGNDRSSDPAAAQFAKQQLTDRMMYNTEVSGTNNMAPYTRTSTQPAPTVMTKATPGSPSIPVLPGHNGNPLLTAIATAMGTSTLATQQNNAITQGDAIATFHERDATQGSRYLFKQFVHGYVLNAQDSIVQDPGLLFNYDKMSGNLLLTKDRVTVIAIYNDHVRTFTLFDQLNQPYTFAMVPLIDNTHYEQVLADGSKYKIYKAIKTTFVKANYTSDGVASSGNNYDEYQDSFTYYLLNAKTGQVQQISLKKKALKQAFAGDENKLDSYFKQNDGDIDDGYLAALGDYMNK